MKDVIIVVLSLIVFENIGIARTHHWATCAKKDLDLIRTTILENHPVQEDSNFINWLQQGYLEAFQRAQCARSFADYKAVLNSYITGFSDKHIEIRFIQAVKNYWWPGFIVQYHSGKYQVGYVKKCLQRQIPIGAELIAVDGLPVKDFIDSYIKPFNSFISGLNYYKHAENILIHDGNQWQPRPVTCTLVVDGHQKSIPLCYKRIHVCTFDAYASAIEPKEQSKSLESNIISSSKLSIPLNSTAGEFLITVM